MAYCRLITSDQEASEKLGGEATRLLKRGGGNRDVGKIAPFVNATTMKRPENCSLKYLKDKKNLNNYQDN